MRPPRWYALSNRELEVAKLIANSQTYDQAAILLGITVSTVYQHTENIYKKLDVHSKTDLTHYMLAAGLVKNIYETIKIL